MQYPSTPRIHEDVVEVAVSRVSVRLLLARILLVMMVITAATGLVALAQSYEDVIVSGAGTTSVNHTCEFTSMIDGKPSFRYSVDPNVRILWSIDKWLILDVTGWQYVNYSDTPTPPSTGWELSMNGLAPAPTLSGGSELSFGITVTPTSGLTTTEALGTDTFTVVLDSEPTDTVTIGISSDNTDEGTAAPATLTFLVGNWDTPQTVTVTGVDDDVDDGDIAYTIVTAAATGGDYAGLDADDVSVTNTDDDAVGITVTPTSGLTTTEAGGTATYTVVLNSEPAGTLIESMTYIFIQSSDATEGTVLPTGLTFNEDTWDEPQTVTVTGVNDDVDDGDIAYTIDATAVVSGDPNYHGIDVDVVSVTNTDDDTAGVTVTPTSGLTTTEAGGTATYTVVLSSEPAGTLIESMTYVLIESSDTTEGTALPAGLTFNEDTWDEPQTVTVTGVDDDIDDGDIAYTIVTMVVVSGDPNYNGIDVDDVSVTNSDDDAIGITVTPRGLTTTEAGGTDTFTVVLDTQPTASVTIDISSDDTTEGTVLPASLTFEIGDWDAPQLVTVTGVDDDETDGDIAYTIITAAALSTDVNYAGMDPEDVLVINEDNDVTLAPIPAGDAGPGEFLDVVLLLAEGEQLPMIGELPLAAIHAVGSVITGGCQFLSPLGQPGPWCFVHIYVSSVDMSTFPETVVLLAHWTADFNWDTYEYEIVWDTAGLAPGYYDLRLFFGDEDTTLIFRIELTPPAE